MAKQLIFVAALVLLGATVGVGRTLYDLGYFFNTPWQHTPTDPELAGSAPPGAPQPAVVVDSDSYDFGKMQRGEKQRHVFTFRNDGKGVLLLRPGQPSCKCTVSNVSKRTVQPGETSEVLIEWTAEQEPGPFRKTAPIYTNDRRRLTVQLEIKGNVVQNFVALPGTFELGRVIFDQPRTSTMRLYGFGKEPLAVLGSHFLTERTA